MKRFYCTRTPDGRHSSPDFLKATIAEAVEAATDRVGVEGGTVYVVQIIRKVDRAAPPVKVTVVK